MKKINYSKDAARALSRMQPKRADAILDKVEAYARGESVDIKKLKGSVFYRIRVGQDRVIIDDENNVVLVLKVGPRGDIYEP